MKKIILSAILGGVMAFSASPVLASATPSQCSSMTFDHVITVTAWGQNVKGTSGRDLIFVNGGSMVSGLGGNDCIVTSSGGNYIDAGAGHDVVVASGWGNYCVGAETVVSCN